MGLCSPVDKSNTTDSVSQVEPRWDMASRRWILLALGVVLALSQASAQAQTTGGNTTGGNTTGGTTGGNTTGGSTGVSTNTGASSGTTSTAQGVNAAIGSGLVTSVATIAANGGTPTATGIPSTSNYLGSAYVNYFSLGLPQNYQNSFGAKNTSGNLTGTFGKYIYVPNPAAATAPTTSVSNQGTGFGTFGQPRAPVYSTALAETFPVVQPQLSWVQNDVRNTIASSSMLKNRASIQTDMKGAIVLLNGVVGSETERATAEGMVRMTPGVQDVQNNLVVDPRRK
jgi:hypothetical protein